MSAFMSAVPWLFIGFAVGFLVCLVLICWAANFPDIDQPEELDADQ